jgi:hypothetical protein
MSISLSGGISINPPGGGISTPGGISITPQGSPRFGNILTGQTGQFVGYRESGPALGQNADLNPDPPGGGTTNFAIMQLNDLTWDIRFTPSTVLQNAWTTVTLDNEFDTPIVLSSAAATYTANVNPEASTRWVFAATADILNKLGQGVGFSAVFA